MNAPIGTIRTFTTPNFRVIVDALPEDMPVDVDDDGETARAVDAGEFEHFVARVRVIHRPTGAELASDYLGGCIYRRIEDFEDHREVGRYNRELAAKGERARCGSYFAGMVRQAIADARDALDDIRSTNVRKP